LRKGDVLLTVDGDLTVVMKGAGKYGHTAVVLDVHGDVVRALSADERGFYEVTNVDKFVRGCSWYVYRVSGMDTIKLGEFAKSLNLEGGYSQYFRNSGGNV